MGLDLGGGNVETGVGTGRAEVGWQDGCGLECLENVGLVSLLAATIMRFHAALRRPQ